MNNNMIDSGNADSMGVYTAVATFVMACLKTIIILLLLQIQPTENNNNFS